MPQFIICEKCGEEKDNGHFPMKLSNGDSPRLVYIKVCYQCQGNLWNPVITKKLGYQVYG